MKKNIYLLTLFLLLGLQSCDIYKTVELRIIQTTDVHGSFFPYDFINRKPRGGSLARAITYIDSLRNKYGDKLLLLDNGDILQGQPTCYYYNFIDTTSVNIAAQVINYMKYDAETIGNHDVEPGHKVYDKWVSEVECPVLGANVIDTKTNKPYLKPYALFDRDGVKVAVIGLLTPAIPNWLEEPVWSGLRFDEMVSSAKYWVKYLQENEKPDVVIGLFHSGKEGGITSDTYVEDASLQVAREVEGFDLILFGHDHTVYSGTEKSPSGKDVLCLNPSNNVFYLADATISLMTSGKRKKRKVMSKTVTGRNVPIGNQPIDQNYISHFKGETDKIDQFVNKKIGVFSETVYTRDSFFGSSAFTDLIHDLQMEMTGADISFNAPLTFNATINKGDIFMSDLFNLYKFENKLYLMKMTGEEIRKHLEMSYDLWVNTMKSPDDHIMLLSETSQNDNQRYGFKNMTFNFDSAVGIDYEVDVTKPDGQKVRILRMSNGEPFDESKWYKVAMNSYRGNGGGELLIKGAGIPQDQLKSRRLYESDRDQRYYLMEKIEREGTITPKAHNNWRFVPDELVKPAIERDRQLIFGKAIDEKDIK